MFQEDPADESKPEREEGELVSDDTKQQKRQEHEAAEAERQVRAADPAPFSVRHIPCLTIQLASNHCDMVDSPICMRSEAAIPGVQIGLKGTSTLVTLILVTFNLSCILGQNSQVALWLFCQQKGKTRHCCMRFKIDLTSVMLEIPAGFSSCDVECLCREGGARWAISNSLGTYTNRACSQRRSCTPASCICWYETPLHIQSWSMMLLRQLPLPSAEAVPDHHMLLRCT